MAFAFIRTVADHAVRTTPRSSSAALERRDRINERQRLSRIVPVGASQADGRHRPSGNQMTLAGSLGSIGRIGASLRSAIQRAQNNHRPPPVTNQSGRDVTREPIEQREVIEPKYRRFANLVSVANTSSQSRTQVSAASSAKAKDKENAGEAHAIRDARLSTVRSSSWNLKERVQPQCIRKQRGAHSCPRYRECNKCYRNATRRCGRCSPVRDEAFGARGVARRWTIRSGNARVIGPLRSRYPQASE
jgi:hypothetical protein